MHRKHCSWQTRFPILAGFERGTDHPRMAAVIERVTTPSTNGHARSAGAAPAKAVKRSTTTSVSHAPMRTHTRTISVETDLHVQFVDITDEVQRSLAESGVQNGFAVVFSRHTTAGIRI